MHDLSIVEVNVCTTICKNEGVFGTFSSRPAYRAGCRSNIIRSNLGGDRLIHRESFVGNYVKATLLLPR